MEAPVLDVRSGAAPFRTLRGNAAPMLEELTMLTGDPARYQAYASSYFEAELPLDEIAHVLAGRPLR